MIGPAAAARAGPGGGLRAPPPRGASGGAGGPARYTAAISRSGHLRASDADRDQVADRLRAAATEGRIGFEELEERLGATLTARTYADLDRVVADLPPSTPARRGSRLPGSPVAQAAVGLAVIVPLLMAIVIAITAILSVGVTCLLACWLIFRPGYGHRSRYHRSYRQAHPGRGFWG